MDLRCSRRDFLSRLSLWDLRESFRISTLLPRFKGLTFSLKSSHSVPVCLLESRNSVSGSNLWTSVWVSSSIDCYYASSSSSSCSVRTLKIQIFEYRLGFWLALNRWSWTLRSPLGIWTFENWTLRSPLGMGNLGWAPNLYKFSGAPKKKSPTF